LKYLLNHINKEVKNPTIRWIFQIIQIYQENIAKPVKQMIVNLNMIRKKIISLFGESACKMYGLVA